MRTIRNVVGILFMGLVFATYDAHPLASVNCDGPTYAQYGPICQESWQCTWDSGVMWSQSDHGFEDVPACVRFDWGAFNAYLYYDFGANWEYDGFQCYDHCLVTPPWNPDTDGCGTYGSFAAYQEYVGTCPQ